MKGKELVAKMAEENIGLLYKFAYKNCRNLRLTSDELVSLFSVRYMRSILFWLKNKPKEQLSTYIWNGLKWEYVSILKKKKGSFNERLIHIPGFKQKSEQNREKAKHALNLIHFHGSESKRNDSALLHHDVQEDEDYKYRIKITDEFLSKLSKREILIIRLRFGMETGVAHTLKEIGAIIGISRERVRQLESRSLNKIQSQCNHLLTYKGKVEESSKRKKLRTSLLLQKKSND